MSCLLFDLGIEPLACALRKSPLRGIEVPGVAERVLAALYADDSSVFMHETDKYETLDEVLTKWCRGSRAMFNRPKTELIPMGEKKYREMVYKERRLTEGGPRLPEGIKIAEDGKATRLLGAWIGNDIDNSVPWSKLVTIIQTNLARWAKRNPTLTGRKLIVGLEVGSRTQYLARVQTMPKSVEKNIVNIIR